MEDEVLEERRLKRDVEEAMDDLRETYNTSRREVGRLEQEVKNSKESILKMTTLYHESSARLDKEKKEFNERARNYKEKLDEVEDENEDLKGTMQRNKMLDSKMSAHSND